MMSPLPEDRTASAAPRRQPDWSSADDVALARRIAGGDERALAELYDRWVHPVYSLAMQLLGDHDEAEDVVEETFWQAWQRASSADVTRGALHSWLLTAAHDRAIDRLHLRHQRHETSLPDRGNGVFTVTPADAQQDSVGRALFGGAQRARMQSALLDLPADQRRTIELAYYGGMSQREIASYLQLPLDTVKLQMWRGMRTIRARLDSVEERSA
jgi:RNA polymerase sigma-70 factor (ECF subfamily)